jgi:hypothetical protein
MINSFDNDATRMPMTVPTTGQDNRAGGRLGRSDDVA